MSRSPRTRRVPHEEVGEASRKAAAGILQVLAGLRTPAEVGEALGVSVNRYYQLEQRALEGMLLALEPRTRGPRRSPAAEAETLRRRLQVQEREVSRYQALLRASQRALGLKAVVREKRGKGKARRPRVRAKAVIAALEGATPVAATVTGEGGA
jgi:hypothetical protein